VVFWTTYVLEKTISLWQGRPSCLNVRGEIDTFLPLSDQDVCERYASLTQKADNYVACLVAEQGQRTAHGG
jgi:hypothetical protein